MDAPAPNRPAAAPPASPFPGEPLPGEPLPGEPFLAQPRPAVLLVGMPACGKSTVGVPLAGLLGLPFVDPDRLIEAGEGRALGEVSAAAGSREAFLALEQRYNLAVPAEPSVIAPGGSVIYCAAAMERFRTFARVLWLDVPVEELGRRLGCLKERAVVIAPGATLHDLAAERRPLLDRWSDARFDTAGKPADVVAAEIAAWLGERP